MLEKKLLNLVFEGDSRGRSRKWRKDESLLEMEIERSGKNPHY